MLFDGHWYAFRVFDGVPDRGIYDNMKTAVDRVGRGKQRDVTVRFLAMTSHYVFEPGSAIRLQVGRTVRLKRPSAMRAICQRHVCNTTLVADRSCLPEP